MIDSCVADAAFSRPNMKALLVFSTIVLLAEISHGAPLSVQTQEIEKIEYAPLTAIYNKMGDQANVSQPPDEPTAPAPKSTPAAPAEYSNWTPTDTTNPSTNFVGTVLMKDDNGKYYSTSDAILLAEKACKPQLTVDTAKDDVYSETIHDSKGISINLGVVKFDLGKEQALKLSVAKIGSSAGTLDPTAVDKVRKAVEIDKNANKYWVCTGQEVFATTYQTYKKGKIASSGTYSVVAIGGTTFLETEKMKKVYNFRLKLVPLEKLIMLPTASPTPAASASPSASPKP